MCGRHCVTYTDVDQRWIMLAGSLQINRGGQNMYRNYSQRQLISTLINDFYSCLPLRYLLIITCINPIKPSSLIQSSSSSIQFFVRKSSWQCAVLLFILLQMIKDLRKEVSFKAHDFVHVKSLVLFLLQMIIQAASVRRFTSLICFFVGE